MKSKLIMMGLMVVLALSLVACGAPAQPAGLWVWAETYCDEFYNNKHISETIEVNTGDTLVVVLCSNPTTGFRWVEEAQISDTGVLKQVSHEFIGPESEPPPPPGTPGQEAWTFEVLKEGTSTVSMEYSRPWEGGEKGEWTYTLTVIVP
jgi:inhibitor of cysteine peptidase